jgi:[histone H3]-lysine36 N-dimethyltransferase SETMAR
VPFAGREHHQVRRPHGLPLLLYKTEHAKPNLLFAFGSGLDGMSNPGAPDTVTESAELVLPLLPPQDLAAAASACRALRAAVTAVTARRAGDAARGLEPLPIPFRNYVDSKPYAYFLYTPFSLTRLAPGASAPSAQPWGAAWTRPPRPTWPRPNLDGLPSAVYGCACAAAECGGTQCACADVEADAAGSGLEAGMGSLTECGDVCACAPSCGNRRTQRGVAVRLCVVRHLHKGWGLHAAEALSCGQFVCEYAGKAGHTPLSGFFALTYYMFGLHLELN